MSMERKLSQKSNASISTLNDSPSNSPMVGGTPPPHFGNRSDSDRSLNTIVGPDFIAKSKTSSIILVRDPCNQRDRFILSKRHFIFGRLDFYFISFRTVLYLSYELKKRLLSSTTSLFIPNQHRKIRLFFATDRSVLFLNGLAIVTANRLNRRKMSQDDKREFDNPFPCFQARGNIASLLHQNGEKLSLDLEQMILAIVKRELPSLEYAVKYELDSHDWSVYTGTTGISLLYLLMHEKLDSTKNYLKSALDLTKPALKRLKNRKFSFLCGDAGPLACLAVLYFKSGLYNESSGCVEKLITLHSNTEFSDVPDEMLVGRIGYLQALLYVRKHNGYSMITSALIEQVVDKIIDSGKHQAAKTTTGLSLMYEWHETHYFGAAHGLAGIITILLKVFETPECTDNKNHLVLIESTIEGLIRHKLPSGNYPSSLRSCTRDKLVHWCHGAPGFVYMFLEAFKVFKRESYLNEAMECADVVWTRGILRKGYGLCHGVAGNAYCFIAMYRTTGDQKYLYRALKFSEWLNDMGKHGCRTPDRPYSLFEGLAGPLYFLIDITRPQTASFPGFEL